MNAAGEELKAVRLELPIGLHRQLRLEAAKEEKSMAALVKALVEDYLKRKARRGDEKQ